MVRHKEKDKQGIISDTRQKLLTAATQEVARYGFERANINQISASAGYAKGTIYNYFPTKRALMLALIDEFTKNHFEFIADKVIQVNDPISRLKNFFVAGFEWIEENLQQGRVMVATLNGPDVEFKEHLYAAYQPMFELVGIEIIGLGISQGLFRGMEPGPTAGMVMTIYLGFGSTVDDRGHPNVAPEKIADLVLHGLIKV